MMMLSCLGLGPNGVGVSSARTDSIDKCNKIGVIFP